MLIVLKGGAGHEGVENMDVEPHCRDCGRRRNWKGKCQEEIMKVCTKHVRVRTSVCLILTVLLALTSVVCTSPRMAAAQTTSTIQNSGSVTVTDADRVMDAAALEILCKTHGNFEALRTYMESQGWIHGGTNSSIVSDSLVPSNLNLTMDRYYYYSTPVKVKSFIYFTWHDVYVLDGGDNDTVGIAFNGGRLQPVDSAFSAYHGGQDISSSGMMWLSDTNTNGYTWGLYEPEFGVNYVDEGAASITLLGRDNSGVTDNFYGKYVHVFNTTHVSISIGFPSGIVVSGQSGPDVWTKAVTSSQ